MEIRIGLPALVWLVLAAASASSQERRTLDVDDVYALRVVSGPRLSPDATEVAYTVRWMDRTTDEPRSSLRVAPVEGSASRSLTGGESWASTPRYSPDGRYLAFLASQRDEPQRVWLLDRRGGEPWPLSPAERRVSDLAWAPDSRRLALVVADPDPEDQKPEDDDAAPEPIVIRRLQFKRDPVGYVDERRDHIHLLEVPSGEMTVLTSGPWDDSEPTWSPDSTRIAFVSKRGPDPDAGDDSDIFLVDTRPGATPRRVADSEGADRSPAFSPDGRRLVYVAGGDPKLIRYAMPDLAVVDVAGGRPRLVARDLDRRVFQARFSDDGDAILFLLENGGNRHLARAPLDGGPVERLLAGERDVSDFDVANGVTVVLEGRPDQPAEISRLNASGELQRVTRENDAFLSGIRLGRVERFRATSPDGTTVDAFLTYPPDHASDEPLPALLRIHGGPVTQYSTDFNLEWQLLAAHGYAVVGANPRGSSGYGEAFAKAIRADWGALDSQDVLAALDEAIARGVADPERLGVGGWSYGGILTNHVLIRTDRFKAGISGASDVNYLSNYGTDHHQHEWEQEFGLPWKNAERWMRLSPFFGVEKIVTPTLLISGENDVDVPLLNSEQLYQALRRLGRETELVVYPGEHHAFRRPSHVVDRYRRYLAWYDRWVKGEER